MRRPSLLLLVAALPLLWAARLRSEPAPPKLAFRLDYKPSPGAGACPPASSLDAFTGGKFGYDLLADDARASLSVTIRRKAGKLEAGLVARDEEGTPRWETVVPSSYTCEDLIEDVALQLFIQFGPSDDPPPAWALAEPPPPAEPPPAAVVPPAPPAPAVPPPRPPAPAPAPAAPSSPPSWLIPKAELSAAFVFAPFDTPGAAFGGSLQAAARWSFASLGLEVRGVVDHRGSIERDSVRVPARALLGTGAFIPCLLIHRFRACGLFAFGVYGGPPSSAYGANETSGRFAGVGLRASYEYPIGSGLLLRGYGDALIPTLRTRSSVASAPAASDKENLWEPYPVLPSVGLALVWRP
ncbi:hypothetical protein [Polyangium aurulentum]|uniref:hypothetical protein n=1 Tax=Polyangium aurulentum TaxID=2567896 RepID=UPI001981DD0F|nr:hypothetical protein [Polyangium aurulentum]UQA60412.1 hypothetical protein E8A73_008035 [Polyangium aurulentum]